LTGVKLRSPTTILLHRARIIFVATALIPNVLMTAIGVLFLAAGGSKSVAVIGGILVLAFCATALTGYTLGTIFVTRGAALASVQNEFLSAVSHELRTPLTSIRMFIDTLREDRVTDPAERQRCLAIINQELGRLDGLVGKLIELSKIESRHTAFDKRPVAVADVIDDALATFETIRFSTEVDLRVDVEPGLMVRGDRAALAQAVGNLLANAWKYTPPVDKKIEITAKADLERVVIAVTDNGAGVPATERELIFEKFQRGRAALDTGSPGTGLGLAIVRAIVRAHKGEVDVQAAAEHGASIRITRPRWRHAA
jgi:two-component system phosphate regulon sensor histidine kinase PhoR